MTNLTSEHPSRPRAWQGRLLLLLISLFVSLVAAEVGARAFWRVQYDVPFRRPDLILYAYYPELRSIDAARPTRGDKFYDILFLGGSALHPRWSQIEQVLREQLASNGYRNIRIFNLAQAGHTSRDSWLKYAAVHEARFDLVIFYHGINEARANNVPPEIFREDYSHYSWYEVVNLLAPYHRATHFALPYTMRYAALRVRQIFTSDRYVPTHYPRKEWIRYGSNSYSAASFKRNLVALLGLAYQRDDRVLLMTFATYIPGDYSREAFNEKRLDYGLHLTPIEMWGQLEDVRATVAIHNAVARDQAAQHPGVLFVDQARLMPASGLYFNDVCHFTVLGSQRFVGHILDALLPTLRSD